MEAGSGGRWGGVFQKRPPSIKPGAPEASTTSEGGNRDSWGK